ncbi:MAG TPA: hypothetical protein VIR45_13955 [Kiloniellaceae bacterium]
MTATTPYLNHKPRTEREAALEIALARVMEQLGRCPASAGGYVSTAYNIAKTALEASRSS